VLTNTVCALRFLYHVTLKRDWSITARDVPFTKRAKKLPVVLSLDEAQKFLVSLSYVKHRAILATLYDCGLRVSARIIHAPRGGRCNPGMIGDDGARRRFWCARGRSSPSPWRAPGAAPSPSCELVTAGARARGTRGAVGRPTGVDGVSGCAAWSGESTSRCA